MSLIVCPECGHENQLDARFCDMCGVELPAPPPLPVSQVPLKSEFEQIETVSQKALDETVANKLVDLDVKVDELVMGESTEQPQPKTADLTPNQLLDVQDKMPIKKTEIAEVSPTLSNATMLDWDPQGFPPTSPPTMPETPRALLIEVETGQSFELPGDLTQIYLGKPNENIPIQVDLSSLVNSDIISRVHALIHVENDKFYLEDAGSLNGTSLNGEIIKPGVRFRKELNTGDSITLGRNRTVNLTFQIQE